MAPHRQPALPTSPGAPRTAPARDVSAQHAGRRGRMTLQSHDDVRLLSTATHTPDALPAACCLTCRPALPQSQRACVRHQPPPTAPGPPSVSVLRQGMCARASAAPARSATFRPCALTLAPPAARGARSTAAAHVSRRLGGAAIMNAGSNHHSSCTCCCCCACSHHLQRAAPGHRQHHVAAIVCWGTCWRALQWQLRGRQHWRRQQHLPVERSVDGRGSQLRAPAT